MGDVLRAMAQYDEELLRRVAERDRKLVRPVSVKRKRDEGEHAKGFTTNPK